MNTNKVLLIGAGMDLASLSLLAKHAIAAGHALIVISEDRAHLPKVEFCNGDLPGHEFHGNQYSASEQIQAQPGYRKTTTDKKTGVKEHFVHTNATTPKQAAEKFVKEAKAKGADDRTRLVSSDGDKAEAVVHNNGQVHRVHFVRGFDQMHNEAETFIGFTNEMSIGADGWAQIAPFGDFPGMALIQDGTGRWRKEPAIQRMDKEAATQMVNDYKERRKGITGFLKAVPIYLGHPDAPGATGEKYPDKNPKGVFSNIEVRDDGLYGQMVLTDEGEELIASKKVRALSGRWDAQYVNEQSIGGRATKIYRPARLYSAGLTDRPNLPVQLLNEEETENTEMKKTQVVAVLMACGITTPAGAAFTNESSDEDVAIGLAALESRAKSATTLQTEKAQLANEKATLEGKVNTLTTEKGTLTTDLGTARTQFANERKARIDDALSNAVRGGFIAEADRKTWETRLAVEANFANEMEALSKLNKKLKTESVTLSRGDRKVEITNASQRREVVAEIVNERIQSAKCDYDAAFSWAQKTYPQLFGAMEQPEVKKGGARK